MCSCAFVCSFVSYRNWDFNVTLVIILVLACSVYFQCRQGVTKSRDQEIICDLSFFTLKTILSLAEKKTKKNWKKSIFLGVMITP